MSPPHERLLYAHRGASRRLPENTLAAFRRGLDDGANALELDVHATSDGAIVVSHDPDGRRSAGVDRAIAGSTLADVQAWDLGRGFVDAAGARPFVGAGHRVPTLEAVLAEFPGMPLNVDLKPPDLALVPRVLELLSGRAAFGHVRLASFHDAVLAEIRRRAPDARTSLGPRDAARLALLPTVCHRIAPLRGDAAQVPPRTGRLRLDTPRFIARAHGLGLRVDYWVVNEPAQARALLELGADGLITDDPAAIVAEFRAAERRRT